MKLNSGKVLHMKKYTQIKEKERIRIYEGKKRGESIGEIAVALGRSKSTISRELRRNSDQYGYLYPSDGQRRAEQRKAKYKSKVLRIKGLLEYVEEKLEAKWSPIAIAGRWSKEHQDATVTHETIYSFIYSAEGKKRALYKKLPRKKPKRGLIVRRSKNVQIEGRIPITERPLIVETRQEAGHYEGDLFFNKGSMSHNVLNIIERKSRILFLFKNYSKESTHMATIIKQILHPYAPKSVTFDNGTEFAAHTMLNKVGINTYFCAPKSPWQKGSVENANGLLRRFLPFRRLSSDISQSDLDSIALTVNSIPRKSLNFLTPLEVFFRDFNLNNPSVALSS